MTERLTIPKPIIVAGLFAEERAALLHLLATLTPEEWTRPTVCAGWSVHDVAVHLLGGYVGNLSRRRDRFVKAELPPGDDLVQRLNAWNEVWVDAAARISPPVLIQLLDLIGDQLDAYFKGVDVFEMAGGVTWAGEGPAPVWLDIAREFTEHWHHQQHIRDAVGRPILAIRRMLHPVLAAFAFSLPKAFAGVDASPGTTVTLRIEGSGGGTWTVAREMRWRLFEGAPEQPTARITLDQDVAWRMYTKGIGPETARAAATIDGDPSLAEHVFSAVAIMA